MKVLEVMSKSVLTIKAEESVQEAAKAMVRHDHGMLVVVDRLDECRMVGVVTDRDIVEKVVSLGKLDQCIENIMSKNVTSIDANATVEEAKNMLKERHIKRLPVLHDNRLVGVVSITDLH